jgi:hypothetical protein
MPQVFTRDSRGIVVGKGKGLGGWGWELLGTLRKGVREE